jgi:putative serine protease PepD
VSVVVRSASSLVGGLVTPGLRDPAKFLRPAGDDGRATGTDWGRDVTDGWNWRQPGDDDAGRTDASATPPPGLVPPSEESARTSHESEQSDSTAEMWSDPAWSDPHSSASWTTPPPPPPDPPFWWTDAAHDPWRDPQQRVALSQPDHEPEPQPEPERVGSAWFGRRTGWVATIVAGVALLAGAVGGALGIGFATANRAPASALDGASRTVAALAQRPPDSFAAIAARVLPSVVTVKVPVAGGTALGSGFVVSSEGYVITNDHVVSGGNGVSVILSDGSTVTAKLVGSDPESDIAVIKVNRSGLVPLELGNSAGVQVGDPVLAVGSPLALPGTVTSGIISAVDRLLAAGDSKQTRYYAAIQTDAAINHGNSGGPLLDGAGQVIGINSVIKSMATTDDDAGSIGLAFAIPINQARRIAEEIIANGKARRTVIGARLDPGYHGVRLAQVDPAGPAAHAGLHDGDVILSLDGHILSDSTELIALVRKYSPGTAVTVAYQRDSSRKSATVTLAADAK